MSCVVHKIWQARSHAYFLESLQTRMLSWMEKYFWFSQGDVVCAWVPRTAWCKIVMHSSIHACSWNVKLADCQTAFWCLLLTSCRNSLSGMLLQSKGARFTRSQNDRDATWSISLDSSHWSENSGEPILQLCNQVQPFHNYVQLSAFWVCQKQDDMEIWVVSL